VDAGIVAYAGVPVRAPAALGLRLAGAVLGSVCVVDFAPRRWSADDVALLEDMAAAITAELEVRARAAADAVHVVATAADTALQRADAALAESEGRFRTIADSIPQLAWMADETGTIFWYNRRWYEYTGTTPETMRGARWADVHHPDHRARVADGFRAAVAACEPWEDTFPLRARDGSYCWFLSRAVPAPDPATGTVRWFGTNTDVTERIAAEAERERLLRAEQEARLAAEEAGRAKTRFLATMSHELRTPLNAIAGYAELLDMGLRGPVTEAQHADLARIRRSQQHLLGLINDVLNFARLESGAVPFECEDVLVGAVLQDASAMVLPQAAAKGLSFRLEACVSALAVRADREKLRQVLLNLLSNAVKFTAAPGQVRLGCDATDAVVRVVVSDTGIGIPADKRAAVFEPFVQVRSELTRTAEGTGLGLAISRDLARGMGGDLTFEEAAEGGDGATAGGSVFVLTLPRAADVAPAAAALAYAPEVATAEAEAAVRRLLREGSAPPGATRRDDLHAVLRYLNARTSHRYTGLYRFDDDVLRNVALFDREEPATQSGPDAPLGETYCSIVGTTGGTFATDDTRHDPRTAAHPARDAVVSYCGALVRAPDGRAVGTLCSFDVEARPVPSHEIPLLEAVAPLLAPAVLAHAGGTPRPR
jgi:PAS domain S-box-containing protein